MRFLTNKRGTKVWNELAAETIVEWSKEAGKEREKMAKDWIAKARHGEVYIFGANQIVAIDLPDTPLPEETE